MLSYLTTERAGNDNVLVHVPQAGLVAAVHLYKCKAVDADLRGHYQKLSATQLSKCSGAAYTALPFSVSHVTSLLLSHL